MTSTKVIVSGISNVTRRNILFQSAVFWAEDGCKVLYFTSSKFESIPSIGHGPQIPSAEVLGKIRIVYPESLEELIKTVTDILTFRDAVPRVILVESLEEYDTAQDRSLARVCATLCHVANCCASQSNLPTYVLVTLAVTFNKLPPVVCSMFDSVWSFNSCSNVLARVFPPDSPTTQLTLACRSDGALVLRQVCQLLSRH